MQFQTVALALFVAAAAAAPSQPSSGSSDASPASPSSAVTSEAASSSSSSGSSSGASCNFLSCAIAMGPAGLKCVEFAFGGSGKDCLHDVLQDVEHMPSSCADCLNSLFG